MLPARMARAVTKDIQSHEAAVDKFLHDEKIINKIYDNDISEQEVSRINALPFFIYAYSNDSLRFWNTNSVMGTCNEIRIGEYSLLRNDKGIYIEKCVSENVSGTKQRLVVLFPILITYPVDNGYLKSHFAASPYIPIKTKILDADKPVTGAYPITLRDGHTAFYLRFNPQDIQTWSPDIWLLALLVAALLVSVSWIQLMLIRLSRNKSPWLSFFVILCIIAVLRIGLYTFGLPFNLDTLQFFSPSLYASSKYLSSLGDLFINTLFALWITVFVTRHTTYKKFFHGVKQSGLRHLIAVILVPILLAYFFSFLTVVRSLVLDSNISFDVSHFYSINVYTILGLFIIGAVTGVSCIIIYLFNIQLTNLLGSKWIKYVLVAIAGGIGIVATARGDQPFTWIMLSWLILFIALLDIKRLKLVSDLFEPHMVFWAIFICIFSTGVLQFFNHVKERQSRRAFAEQLEPKRDDITEYAFDNIVHKIEVDKQIKAFLYKPTANARKLLDQRFDLQYLNGPLNKYQSRIYLFDEKGTELFNKDTTAYNDLVGEMNESITTNSTYLFYKESILDRHYYLSYIPIYSDTINKRIGYVIIDLDLKKQINETVYPELLQPSSNKDAQNEGEYSYAIYSSGKLVTQVNDYAFTTKLANDTLRPLHYKFHNGEQSSELYFKLPDKLTVVVVYIRNIYIETITLFSYLFVIEMLLAIIVLLYQLYLSYFTRTSFSGRFIKLTLRSRVHLSMLGVVLLSFIIIGFVTILFFVSQYSSSNTEKLRATMQVVKQSIQDHLNQEGAYVTDYVFDTVNHSRSFKNFISGLAADQKIDINVFDERGILTATSQDDIYDRALISRTIRPDAFYQLSVIGKSIVIQNEQVGTLSYLSAYLPLRDERGITLGYINVPFFSSEKDLNFQISNIVVTLINLYAFIFLISSVITVLLTRWITRTFNMIIKQFGRLNLQRNERIEWPYDDEIGLLVAEYNKMVKKVEENAILLAQSERESAWREMARQVAHEIKNPLTPMKLNIQYLQQAFRNNKPNIEGLVDRVSDSIIEQIDNLAYIASEFSNFAKMPEAKPENLDLCDLLNRAVELYMNEPNVSVILEPSIEKFTVFSDRSQLLRVINNLLENAKQAIPESRKGIIIVSVKAEGSEVLITIKDNGEGISDEVIKKIFQPYFTTKSSGTGLGLAMTKKIIEFWKGRIWFDTKEGNGTTFYISLPTISKDVA